MIKIFTKPTVMNRKNVKFYISAVLLMLSVVFGGISPSQAQQPEKKISGKVVDESKEPLPGVSIVVVGTSTGTITDADGIYSLTIPAKSRELKFSFIGFETQQLPVPSGNTLNVQLKGETQELGEIVAIGYGTQRKSDLTGSVSSVSRKDFNSGLISSPEQLINSKISGVQIITSGSPTMGSTIRIRGGASLNASNDPLIVLDGLPLERGGISGNGSNFLSLINPNDIENITILKDASSTAIYGSRASNGVILITTKKGGERGMKINFSTTNSVQIKTKLADMLSTDQFRNVIQTEGTAGQIALLGTDNTNWNDQVYQKALGTDNNLSFSGKLAKNLPARISMGYYSQDGILMTDNAERISGSVSLSPSFLNDQLKFNINAKGSVNNNRFGNTAAIFAASTYNPTLPVYSGNAAFAGYTEAIDNSNMPVNGAVRNPLGLVEQNESTSKVTRLVGNVDMDYKIHFLPDLKFHGTLGYDYAKGEGYIYVPAEATQFNTTSGRDYPYGPQENYNNLLTTYLNYNKFIESISSNLEATVGYDYQYWKTTTPTYPILNTLSELQSTVAAVDQRHALVSYYARLNYSFNARYLLTATVRRDGTSRFSPENRWGTFPSVALGWRVSEESFLKDNDVLSNLKLKLSYGVTGQQDGIGNYSYLPVYTYSQDGAQAMLGNNFYYTYRPEAYVADLKWETTSSINTGIDIGFFKDRLTASIDYYTRDTKDLLATVPAAAGSNFDRNILTNVGNVKSQGIEFSMNANVIKKKDLNWDVNFNMTWQKMNVENLSLVEGGAITNTPVGPTIGGYNFQVLTEGYAPNMFYLYHQLYDEATGRPIEGAFADVDNNGTINSADLYRYHSPAPDLIFGFSTAFSYKNWSLNASLRANVGNYVYNGMAMNTGAWSTVSYNSYQLNNLSSSYLKTGFQNRQYLSDYNVENGSFLKMDNLTLGYNFGKIGNCCSLNVNGMVQNVFTITNYSGVDPEVPNGMDVSFYTRPRIFSLGLGLEF